MTTCPTKKALLGRCKTVSGHTYYVIISTRYTVLLLVFKIVAPMVQVSTNNQKPQLILINVVLKLIGVLQKVFTHSDSLRHTNAVHRVDGSTRKTSGSFFNTCTTARFQFPDTLLLRTQFCARLGRSSCAVLAYCY